MNKLEKIGKDLFVGNHIPIVIDSEVVGGVSTLRDISNVVKAENEVRRSITINRHDDHIPCSHIIAGPFAQQALG